MMTMVCGFVTGVIFTAAGAALLQRDQLGRDIVTLDEFERCFGCIVGVKGGEVVGRNGNLLALEAMNDRKRFGVYARAGESEKADGDQRHSLLKKHLNDTRTEEGKGKDSTRLCQMS